MSFKVSVFNYYEYIHDQCIIGIVLLCHASNQDFAEGKGFDPKVKFFDSKNDMFRWRGN